MIQKVWLCLAFCILFTASNIAAQEPVCSDLKYENRNQIDQPVFQVDNIRGQIFYDGDKTTLPGLCVALYREGSKKRIRAFLAEETASFRFTGIKNGRYILLVQSVHNAFCPANIRVRVIRRPRNRTKLRIYMLGMRMDECSYATAIKK
jgi:hypothetical protein